MPLIRTFEVRRYRAAIWQHPHFETMNGYLGLPPGHPANGMDYEEAPGRVHGGWTYASTQPPEGVPPAPGWWWLGFDCAHAWDYAPGIVKRVGRLGAWPGETYKTDDYVEKELRSAAAQLDDWAALPPEGAGA
jgi:hypothetical protein